MTMNDVKDLIDTLYVRKNYLDCPECDARMSEGEEHGTECRLLNIEKFAEEFTDEQLKL